MGNDQDVSGSKDSLVQTLGSVTRHCPSSCRDETERSDEWPYREAILQRSGVTQAVDNHVVVAIKLVQVLQ